jgi:prepilin-type N-terminal cleavage/methylation domain-containing protein
MTTMRDESGFTLIELLVAMSLTVVMIGATVSAFVTFNTNERVNRKQNDAQDQARQGVERLSRQLRNLASPLDRTPRAIDLAEPDDLVFQTVSNAAKPAGSLNDRNIMRVRYCLSNTVQGRETLWRGEQTWTSAAPPVAFPETASCPGPWANKTVVAENIVTRSNSDHVFSYTPSSVDLTAIRAIQTELFVDVTPGTDSPAASRLASGVFLRNQNRVPVASCSAVFAGTGQQVVLNGSGSSDPEGRNIVKYQWFRSMSDATAANADSRVLVSGVVGRWTAPSPGNYTLVLKVTDVGGLAGFGECNSVVVPT